MNRIPFACRYVQILAIIFILFCSTPAKTEYIPSEIKEFINLAYGNDNNPHNWSKKLIFYIHDNPESINHKRIIKLINEASNASKVEASNSDKCVNTLFIFCKNPNLASKSIEIQKILRNKGESEIDYSARMKKLSQNGDIIAIRPDHSNKNIGSYVAIIKDDISEKKLKNYVFLLFTASRHNISKLTYNNEDDDKLSNIEIAYIKSLYRTSDNKENKQQDIKWKIYRDMLEQLTGEK